MLLNSALHNPFSQYLRERMGRPAQSVKPCLIWPEVSREYSTTAKNCLFINLPTCYPTFPLMIQPISGMCGIFIHLLCYACFGLGLYKSGLGLIQSNINKRICNICMACFSQIAFFKAQKSAYLNASSRSKVSFRKLSKTF